MTEFIFSGFNFDKFDLKKIDLNEISGPEINGLWGAVFIRRILPFFNVMLFFLYSLTCRRLSLLKREEGTVIYFAIEDMYSLSMGLLKNRQFINQAIWLWNPVATIFGQRWLDRFLYQGLFLKFLRIIGVDIWTFDKEDAKKYSLNYHPQIHSLEIKKEVKCDSKTFFFVGEDKGRLNKLVELKNLMYNSGVECHLLVKKNHGVIYSEENKALLTDQLIPYFEYLGLIETHAGLIDFVQKNQSGLTLRVLESLFYQKKLITNNISIKEYDFYRKENIFLIDKDFSQGDFESFIKEPYFKIDRDILMKYNVESLISNVLMKKNTRAGI